MSAFFQCVTIYIGMFGLNNIISIIQHLRTLIKKLFCVFPEVIPHRFPKKDNYKSPFPFPGGAYNTMMGCPCIPGLTADLVIIGPEQIVGILEEYLFFIHIKYLKPCTDDF